MEITPGGHLSYDDDNFDDLAEANELAEIVDALGWPYKDVYVCAYAYLPDPVTGERSMVMYGGLLQWINTDAENPTLALFAETRHEVAYEAAPIKLCDEDEIEHFLDVIDESTATQVEWEPAVVELPFHLIPDYSAASPNISTL